MKSCSSPCKTGMKSNSAEPCRCVCKNQGLSTDCCPSQKGFAEVTVTVIKAMGWNGRICQTLPSSAGDVRSWFDRSFPWPSPMDAQLEEVYVSHNARPIPTGMLVEMGVLLDERIPRFNQSNIRKNKGFEL
ncbi:hypothetical protein KOW79_001219 [Hemibagrus wyckioides]|uniref:Uncharacterized protein n=1 Tax=Hemibagrus wyckioides TaxID=337641 RepID=A0A9D3SXE4_9TELE|nr:hypothetical protein KOW79_001219 [Hemibagrus wyckioides]